MRIATVAAVLFAATAITAMSRPLRRNSTMTVAPSLSPKPKLSDNKQLVDYLIYYGYLRPRSHKRKRESNEDDDDDAAPQQNFARDDDDYAFETRVLDALGDLQLYAGRSITGELDDDTLELLTRGRCGVPDSEFALSHRRIGRSSDDDIDSSEPLFAVAPSDRQRRREKYDDEPRRGWPSTDLTWRLLPDDPAAAAIPAGSRIGARDDVRRNVVDAFAMWDSSHGSLRLREVPADSASNISIRFVSRDHGDGWPFDGPGRILAHAFLPNNGKVHIDYDERWRLVGATNVATTITSSSIDLLPVLIHEIGHALGLGHERDKTSVMFPWYKRFDDRALPEVDRANLRALYGDDGSGAATSPTPPATTTPATSGATSRAREKRCSVHRGVASPPPSPVELSVYGGHEKRRRFVELICARPELRSYDDLAIVRGRPFLFKGDRVWAFDSLGRLLPGYPASIARRFPALRRVSPQRVSAIYETPPLGHLYFVMGDRRYSLHGATMHLRENVTLNELGLPDGVTVVHASRVDRGTYLFDSANRYWRISDSVDLVDWDYPRAIESLGTAAAMERTAVG